MTKTVLVVGTLLVIIIVCCTPSQSALHMCRNDTETKQVVTLYHLNKDGGSSVTDCQCKIRPLPGDRVGLLFNATYIKGCQYSLTISHKTSRRYLNCDSNLALISYYYNIRDGDEITLNLTNYVSSASDGLDYYLKISASESNVTVMCYTAGNYPVHTRFYSSTTSLSYSRSKSVMSTKSQQSTTRPDIISSTLSGTSLRRRYTIPSDTLGVNLSIETTNDRPSELTLPASTRNPYFHQASTGDLTDNENFVIGVSLGCLTGGIVIIILLVVGIKYIRKRVKQSEDDIYERTHIRPDDDSHIYASFRRERESGSVEPSVSFHNVQLSTDS